MQNYATKGNFTGCNYSKTKNVLLKNIIALELQIFVSPLD